MKTRTSLAISLFVLLSPRPAVPKPRQGARARRQVEFKNRAARGAGRSCWRHRHAALVLLLGGAKGVRGVAAEEQLLRHRRRGFASILMSNPLAARAPPPRTRRALKAPSTRAG